MAHPYRTPPEAPRAAPPRSRLGVATLAFGFLCVLLAEVLAGPDRARMALFGIALGTVLLLSPGVPESVEKRYKRRGKTR